MKRVIDLIILVEQLVNAIDDSEQSHRVETPKHDALEQVQFHCDSRLAKDCPDDAENGEGEEERCDAHGSGDQDRQSSRC